MLFAFHLSLSLSLSLAFAELYAKYEQNNIFMSESFWAFVHNFLGLVKFHKSKIPFEFYKDPKRILNKKALNVNVSFLPFVFVVISFVFLLVLLLLLWLVKKNSCMAHRQTWTYVNMLTVTIKIVRRNIFFAFILKFQKDLSKICRELAISIWQLEFWPTHFTFNICAHRITLNLIVKILFSVKSYSDSLLVRIH